MEARGTGTRVLAVARPDSPLLVSLARVPDTVGIRTSTSLPAETELDGADAVVCELGALDAGGLDRLLCGARAERTLIATGPAARPELSSLFDRYPVSHVTSMDAREPEDWPRLFTNVAAKAAPWDAEAWLDTLTAFETTELSSSVQIRAVLERASRFAREMGAAARLAETFCTVADELLTNAFYNAPRRSDSSIPYAHLARDVPVTLEPGQVVTARFAFDGARLAVEVTDPFGSLTARVVREYLAKGLRRGSDQIDQKPGGAGLGLYYAFEMLSRFVVLIAPGSRTRLLGVLEVTGRYRDHVARARSFDLFVEVPR